MGEEHCVIIGGGHAAASIASTLRPAGWTGRISLVSAEPFPPYHRPPLSKDYLAGCKHIDELLIRPPSFYAKSGVDLVLGSSVVGIERNAHEVTLNDRGVIRYTKLALATGAKVRKLDLEGTGLAGVFYLRSVNDVDEIRHFVGMGKSAVIIGGGFIGLEAAASLRQAKMDVTVIEPLPRVLQRVTAPEVSAFFSRIHAEEGVVIKTDTKVEKINGVGSVESVTCSDGTVINADLVIVGIGILPNIDLASSAGLNVDNGIVVDEYSRTSDHDIVAAGDCTNHFNPIYGRRVRLESVQNATDQGKIAAHTIAGDNQIYRTLPWFWSDQFDVKLQIAGLSKGYDDLVIRGTAKSDRSFAAFYFKEGGLIAVDAINRPKEFMVCRRALAHGKSAAPEVLQDESINIHNIFSG